jgi:hypothetical protein
MVKPPPAERKIFRARSSKASVGNGAQKKIFSSPKKVKFLNAYVS